MGLNQTARYAATALAAITITSGCAGGSNTPQIGQASQQELNDATEIAGNGTTFQVETAKGDYSGSPKQQLVKCFADWKIRLPGNPTSQERRWQTTKVLTPTLAKPYFVGIAHSVGTTYAYVWLTESEAAANDLVTRLNKAAQNRDPGYRSSGLMTTYVEADAVGRVVRAIPDWTNAYFGSDSSAWNGCAARLHD